MSLQWQPYREPIRVTLIRTGMIAVAVGAVITGLSGGGIRAWPRATAYALWPVLGGHFVELFFLNGLRPRLPAKRTVQVGARIAVWFVGGCVLFALMYATPLLMDRFEGLARWPAWWIGGVAFVAIELAVHLVLLMRGVPNFYDGRG